MAEGTSASGPVTDRRPTAKGELRCIEKRIGYCPAEVMKLQVQALRLNDAEDRGIEIVSRFASPDNRRFTGPLPRFTAMLHGPRYRPMLNHRAADFGLVQIEGAVARQRVRVATEGGLIAVYLFSLSRQRGGCTRAAG